MKDVLSAHRQSFYEGNCKSKNLNVIIQIDVAESGDIIAILHIIGYCKENITNGLNLLQINALSAI